MPHPHSTKGEEGNKEGVEFFGLFRTLINVKSKWNLNQEKKINKKKKGNSDPNACKFCRKNRMNVQKVSNMVELVRCVEMSENLPCENCMQFYLSQTWFDVGAGCKAYSEALDSVHRKIDDMKGLKEDL